MNIVIGGLLLFLGLCLVIYLLAERLAPGGGDQGAKRQPYACGQDLTPSGEQLSYGRFYRLALLFIIAHIGALIAMLLSLADTGWAMAVIYLAGVGICVQVLTAEMD
ncbi:MAG: NADH-quinone oxidoreductase subunit A [Anaerolineae bacterium]